MTNNACMCACVFLSASSITHPPLSHPLIPSNPRPRKKSEIVGRFCALHSPLSQIKNYTNFNGPKKFAAKRINRYAKTAIMKQCPKRNGSLLTMKCMEGSSPNSLALPSNAYKVRCSRKVRQGREHVFHFLIALSA